MSCYEEISGHGTLMKKDLKDLKNQLIEASNEQYDKVKRKYNLVDSEMMNIGLKKMTIRDTSFPFYIISTGETYFDRKSGKEKILISASEDGEVTLDFENNTFRFYTDRNNHIVDRLQKSSSTYKKLMDFLKKLEMKGTKYGAATYYTNEYEEEEYDDSTNENRTYYGGWIPQNERKYKKVR